jgi:hypothetical protein
MDGSWDGMIDSVIAALAARCRRSWDGTAETLRDPRFPFSFVLIRYKRNKQKQKSCIAVRSTNTCVSLSLSFDRFQFIVSAWEDLQRQLLHLQDRGGGVYIGSCAWPHTSKVGAVTKPPNDEPEHNQHNCLLVFVLKLVIQYYILRHDPSLSMLLISENEEVAPLHGW